MRISDWSSDLCSSDLHRASCQRRDPGGLRTPHRPVSRRLKPNRLPVDSFGHKEASVYRPAHRGALDMTQSKPRGVYVAALTPVKQDLGPDSAAFVRHCRWLLEQGANGLAVLGTTGEANSFRVDERLKLLDALVYGGIPGATLQPGPGTFAIPGPEDRPGG